jgi:hypothetical protein
MKKIIALIMVFCLLFMNHGCYTTKKITTLPPAPIKKNDKVVVYIGKLPLTCDLLNYRFTSNYLEGDLHIRTQKVGGPGFRVKTENYGDSISRFPVFVRIPSASIQKITYTKLNFVATILLWLL